MRRARRNSGSRELRGRSVGRQPTDCGNCADATAQFELAPENPPIVRRSPRRHCRVVKSARPSGVQRRAPMPASQASSHFASGLAAVAMTLSAPSVAAPGEAMRDAQLAYFDAFVDYCRDAAPASCGAVEAARTRYLAVLQQGAAARGATAERRGPDAASPALLAAARAEGERGVASVRHVTPTKTCAWLIERLEAATPAMAARSIAELGPLLPR
jgi:hypothetical protein